jgi:DNA-binding FadR family transcriptional regulator
LSFENIGKKEMAVLEECLSMATDAIEQEQRGRISGHKSELYDFHVKLAQASNNRVYAYLVASLVEISRSFLNQHVPNMTGGETHIQDHRKILDAIIKKDKKKTRGLLRKHILQMEKNISHHIII